ncbi:hypothetical protein VCSRO18_2428 [Vibrio cholerae]|nr:hypothetical protein VCSRO18_2428 [Vibrio cholerae]
MIIRIIYRYFNGIYLMSLLFNGLIRFIFIRFQYDLLSFLFLFVIFKYVLFCANEQC